MVNILGGGGKNTYVIDVEDGWTSLPGQIHIWDFDPSKDTIFFNTYGSYATPNIQETKRTLSGSSYEGRYSLSPGTLLLEKFSPRSSFWNLFRSSSSYRAAEHEFTGDGIAKLILDEKNYNYTNPNSLFANSNTFKTDASGDVDGTIRSNAQIFIGSGTNTIWSQLEDAGDHDFFKVHVSKGKSYVFTMESNPNTAGDGILHTNLQLRDKFGNQVVASNLVTKSFYDRDNADTKIDFFAASDGDYFLDAGSNNNAGKYSLSATEIIRKSIAPISNNNDLFDPATNNHLAYKMTLVAGDLIQLSYTNPLKTVSITINNDLGKVEPVTFDNVDIKTFFAQTSGDYYIDASVPNGFYYGSQQCVTFGLNSSKKEIAGDRNTMAMLSVSTDVQGSLSSNTDHDWYMVKLTAGSRYRFDMEKAASSPTLDPYLALRDANGNLLSFHNDIGWNNKNSAVFYTAKATGNYYIDAGSFNNNSFGDFTLGFHKIPSVI